MEPLVHFGKSGYKTNKQTPQTFFFPEHKSALSFSENGLLQEETRVQNITGNSAILSRLSSVWFQPYSEGQCPSVPLSTGLRRIQNRSFSTVYSLDMFVRNLKLTLSAAIYRELRDLCIISQYKIMSLGGLFNFAFLNNIFKDSYSRQNFKQATEEFLK